PFSWDSVEALRHWAPGGEIDSVVGRYQIAPKTGLRLGELDGWRLAGALTSINGKEAYTSHNASYEHGRYTEGVRVDSGVRVGWKEINIPAEFTYTFWIRPKESV